MDLFTDASAAGAHPRASMLARTAPSTSPAAAEPLPRFEATLASSFALSGPGLHTGGRTRAVVRPAAPGTGVVFRVPGARAPSRVPALWSLRVPQPLCTALRGPDGALVRTVEHLLAALSALHVDNAEVELDREELPILDGSAAPWCAAIGAAGRLEQGAPRRYLRVCKTVEVGGDGRFLRAEPADAGADGLTLEASLALGHFGELAWNGRVTPRSFQDELAPSRSFGRLRWALPLKLYGWISRRPLLRGAGFGNTATLVGGRVVGGMRLPAEFARHRALDLVGDLALAGHPLIARVTARRTGHDLNHALLARLLADPSATRLATLDEFPVTPAL